MKSSHISSAIIRPDIKVIKTDLEAQQRNIKHYADFTSRELKQNFIDYCMDNIFSHANTHVKVNFDRLLDVVAKLEIQDPSSGFDFASNMTPESADRTKPINPERVFFELAMNVANQGGFVFVGPDGKARKWEIKGSGARAFNDLFLELSKKKLLPGLPDSKIKCPQDVDRFLAPELVQANGEATPFKEDRLAVFREFAEPGAQDKLAKILGSVKQGDGSYLFDFKIVRDIASTFPRSFGQDPFYKKAALLPILFANHANTRGERVTVNSIVAADYRLPQTLHSIGILEFSEELVNRLENEEIMSPDDLMVMQMRAASIYIGELLAKYTGMQINEVDAALWKAMKDGSLKYLQDETFQKANEYSKKITLKQMLVPTFSFSRTPPISWVTGSAATIAAAKAILDKI